jgi:hypothetical protein
VASNPQALTLWSTFIKKMMATQPVKKWNSPPFMEPEGSLSRPALDSGLIKKYPVK